MISLEPAASVEPVEPVEPAAPAVEPASTAVEPAAPRAPAAAVAAGEEPARDGSAAGVEVSPEAPEPPVASEAVSVPIEVSLPRTSSSDGLDVPVDLADGASSPFAARAASITDAGVDLSNLPSSPLSASLGRAAPAAVTAPSAASSRQWQPSRALFFAVAAIAAVLVVALLVTRGRRAPDQRPASSATASEAARTATPEPARTVASEPAAPEVDEEPADPMAAGRARGDEEPAAREPRGGKRAGGAAAAAQEPAAKDAKEKEPASGEDEPAAAPAGTGTVNVYSTPPATVYIDGRRIGVTPKQVTLPAGPHTVVVEDPELGRQSVQVDVQPKKQHSVNLTLD